MNTALSPCLNHADWKTLYRAAILETNRRVIPQKVSEAETAVLARGRELFYRDGASEERESLESALYALRAYKSAWQHTESSISGKNARAAG